MDQARSTISKIFNGEPHSYTRFNLTQNMEGDTSQVEMKLSSDVDEEVGENGVGDHLNHNSGRKPYVVQKIERTPKNICFLAATTLLIFITGYLIGYFVQQKKDLAPSKAVTILPIGDSDVQVARETGAAPLMNWDDVKKFFAQNLNESKFENTLREFTSDNHQAGSVGDEDLGNKVVNRFKGCDIKTWTDEHFIKVQDLPVSGSNKVTFKGKQESVDGFLSYSATGKAMGAVLYAYYGQENDFRFLQDRNVNMNGRVILVRAGKISFAEKVANAAKVNASAVLIYPDAADYSMDEKIALYGHVHLGSGDPYTPGFPSFNHTQFPPIESSGLPSILAQTITAQMATNIMRELGGQTAPADWGGINKLGDENDIITVEVNNVLAEKKITNVFGVIKGFVDADRYVVVGAHRDAWGAGFAASTVGTSVLIELACVISEMVKRNRFLPRRSIVFASWTAGEYGSVGATEWLEGYLSSLSMKAFSYIDLDGVVTGQSAFKVAASPLLYKLIEGALKEVKSPDDNTVTLFSRYAKGNWEKNVLEPLTMDSAAYPFLAFSGIPSVSFRFTTTSDYQYQYLGTMLDTSEKLNMALSSKTPKVAMVAAQFAGHMVLRLIHDHLLRMDLKNYDNVIRANVAKINQKVIALQRMQSGLLPKALTVQWLISASGSYSRAALLPKALTVQWLISASGSYSRAARGLATDIKNSDLEDIEKCRVINDRIMMVERNFLSPYVSPRTSPFRHILLGSGPHTLKALINHLEVLRMEQPEADTDLFRKQFALATWTIQGCANSLAGNIWSLDNQI
ncbi:hypothetical protein LDENG_00106090 [Lucifuga dentata]|nr:hypothetical protein LDENG_00106090 [Lucifuga dentata]